MSTDTQHAHAHAAPHDEDHPVAASLAHIQVVGVTGRHPRARTVVVGRTPLGADVTFLPAVVTGVWLTTKRFFQNLLFRKHTATVPYPDKKVVYPPRYRALHRLMQREDGSPRCVACMMCPTICPARCITIVPGEREDSNEKYPVLFEIDELRCVVCGLCVESCPCDAIRMDTAVHMSPVDRRADAILGKVDLLKRGTRTTAVQGGRGPDWREEERPDLERGPESKAPAAPR